MSDEGDAANDAARDGGATEEGRDSGGRTAVVTKPARPTGKRTRQRMVEADSSGSSVDAESADEVPTKGKASKEDKAKKGRTARAAKTSKRKPGDRSANPFMFVYNYLKQVVAEMRKVIWPNRRQMLTYTSVVLAFLAFMVAVVGLADFGLAKLVLLVFG
ncbi:preprotein translocase subunit SecE [Mycobacterium sp. 1554424.7]|nr:preprotein translocase subunit SecE [Mycobacterium sp. 1554424.7]